MNKRNSRKQHDAIMNPSTDLSELAKEVLHILVAQLEEEDDDSDEIMYYGIELDELQQYFGKKITITDLDEAADGLFSLACTVEQENSILCFRLVTAVRRYLDGSGIELGINSVAKPYLLEMSEETNSKQHKAIMNSIKEALHDFSDLEKEIFCMSLDQLEEDDPIGKEYEIDLKELEQRFGRKITMPELEKALNRLSPLSFTVKKR